MKFITEAQKNLFGKKSGQFVCSLPGTDWKAIGDTRESAQESMLTQLSRQAEWIQTRRYLRGKDSTWCLHYSNGWQYDIVRDSNPTSFSSCMFAAGLSYMRALEQMTKDFNQHETNS